MIVRTALMIAGSRASMGPRRCEKIRTQMEPKKISRDAPRDVERILTGLRRPCANND